MVEKQLDDVNESISQIEDFYKDQTIFITGATGFLGTLLVEKLLRCCPTLNKLILLVRNSRTQSVNDRVREYFCEEIFDRMKLKNPNYFKKVNIIPGHLDKDGFGLDDHDTKFLISNTNVIFHVAATVKFNEHIRVAYDINVKGTKTLLSIAKKMKRLKSFVYVSTAYCNCDRRFIEEKFYIPIYSEPELCTLINACSDEELAILSNKIIDKKPNTYTLTKSIAEDLIREVVSELPVCVFRPSIVLPTLEDPMPLWFKGFNYILAIILGCGVGLLRVFTINTEIVADIVPADKVTSALATVAWYQTTTQVTNDEKVFNYISTNDNKVNFVSFLNKCYEKHRELHESNSHMMWSSYLYTTSSKTLYTVLYYLLHLIPGIFFAAVEKLTARKPMIFKAYRRIMLLTDDMIYFGCTEWGFTNDNTRAMWNAMSNTDLAKFDSSMNNFQWMDMVSHFPRCVAIYMLNDPLTKENYQKRMIYIDRADLGLRLFLKAIFLYFLLKLVAFAFNTVF